MTYKWIQENVAVQRLADGACIPNDPLNRDWRKFQAWVADGNTPTPADTPTKEQRAAPIKAQIAALESKQHRAVREYALGSIEAGERLLAIDAEIAELRKQLK